MSRRRLAVLGAIVLLLPLLSACSVPALSSGTMTLHPSLVLSPSRWHHGYNAFPLCSYEGGLSLIGPAPPGELYVGTIRAHSGGLCWEQIGEAYQVLIQFDLSSLERLENKLVVSAHLEFTERVVTMRATDGTPMRAGGTATCLGPWILPDGDPRATDPWTATGDYTPQARSGNTHRVTWLVGAWVTGSTDNTGILFRGVDPSITARDNGACLSALSGFTLTIQYRSLSV